MSTSARTPYPDYRVLDKWDTPSWNDQTRKVVAHRLDDVPARRFFSEPEWGLLEAVCRRVIPQDDLAQPVPIAPWIDAALYEKRGSGTRFADMPEDGKAWRQGLAAIDAEANERHGTGFATLPPGDADALLRAVDDGDTRSAAWKGLPPRRFFREIALKQIVAIYYVHPDVQSRIGFGGPASPRGYVRLDAGRFDAWEAPPGDWTEGAS